MAQPLRSATDCAAWRELETLAQELAASPTRELFTRDPQRFQHCCIEAAGLALDYSRQRVDARVLPCAGADDEHAWAASRARFQ